MLLLASLWCLYLLKNIKRPSVYINCISLCLSFESRMYKKFPNILFPKLVHTDVLRHVTEDKNWSDSMPPFDYHGLLNFLLRTLLLFLLEVLNSLLVWWILRKIAGGWAWVKYRCKASALSDCEIFKSRNSSIKSMSCLDMSSLFQQILSTHNLCF